MSIFSTARSAAGSTFPRGRTSEVPQPLPDEQGEADASLPRHLLVSLAGITAEVTTLQQRYVATPQLHGALGAIVGRLDGLVDSIYTRAADPTTPSLHRSGPASTPQSDARVGVPVEVSEPTSDAPGPTRKAEASLPSCLS